MSEPTPPGTARPTWGAAGDLSRVVPTGTAAPVTPAVANTVGQPAPNERLVEFAAVTPPSGKRHVSAGLALGLWGRIVVGLLLAAVLGVLLYGAWHNLSSL